eukprot:1751326-Prymnesium_polylepis.1
MPTPVWGDKAGIATVSAARWANAARSWATALEEPLEDLWRLFSKAAAVMVMMLWSHTLRAMLLEGIQEHQKAEGPMFHRLLLTWAATLTAICGFATVRIVRFRRALSRSHARSSYDIGYSDDDDDDEVARRAQGADGCGAYAMTRQTDSAGRPTDEFGNVVSAYLPSGATSP